MANLRRTPPRPRPSHSARDGSGVVQIGIEVVKVGSGVVQIDSGVV